MEPPLTSTATASMGVRAPTFSLAHVNEWLTLSVDTRSVDATSARVRPVASSRMILCSNGVSAPLFSAAGNRLRALPSSSTRT